MYRQGLGDCFLLAFGVSNSSPKYVLIDCGVLLGTKAAEQRITRVGRDILQATGGHIDVLVITHEHWDHISGFVQAREEFKKLDVDEVWFAWTENPANPLARELRERRRAALNGLRLALARVAAKHSVYTERIERIAAFFGPNLGVSSRSSTEEVLEWIKERWSNHRYCNPGGTPITLPGLPKTRFLFLGPPADAKYIRKSRPSSKESEVYLGDAIDGDLGLYLTALGAQPPQRHGSSSGEIFTPFNPVYHRELAHSDVATIAQRYHSDDWRKIDDDWLGMAGELALRLDAHTNNTSLVLAIELAPDNKVLLFAADAQVGNWLSWESVRWSGEYQKLTVADLLARTVLYKVGHHGSHNATLSEKGLERMTDPELAALISVDRKMANTMRWRMPHKPLYDRLVERTLGRVVFSDSGLPPANGDPAVGVFRQSCVETDLYLDITVKS
jgi:beta-lactamase superfamily II metal-dependent hydrolase